MSRDLDLLFSRRVPFLSCSNLTLRIPNTGIHTNIRTITTLCPSPVLPCALIPFVGASSRWGWHRSRGCRTRRTVSGPSATVSVGGAAVITGTCPSYAAGAGPFLAVINTSTAVVILRAAKTDGAGSGCARAELAVKKRWNKWIGEGKEWGDEEESEMKRCGEHFTGLEFEV